MLTGTYLYRVLAVAGFSGGESAPRPLQPVARSRELIVLLLAVVSVLLGLLPLASFEVLKIGREGEPAAILDWSAQPAVTGALWP